MVARTQTAWMTASPLWNDRVASPASMRTPALLRFASDTFMEDLAALLGSAPRTLVNFVAKNESFRPRPAGAPPDWSPTTPVLKLYQPAHGHFSMVAANLVCRLPGLPDHTVKKETGENIGFVLRRIGPTGQEMAWVNNVDKKNWQPLASSDLDKLAQNEVLQPLFPMTYMDGTASRRLFVGLIPTSSRETFQAARAVSPIADADSPPTDPRVQEVENRVLQRWEDLNDPASPLTIAQKVEVSQFILLDFADFLSTKLSRVWNQIAAGAAPANNDAAHPLYAAITGNTINGSTTLSAALKQALAEWDRIGGDNATPTTVTYDLSKSPLKPATLRAPLLQALAAYPSTAPPPADPPVPKLDPSGALYLLRCVYQRPRCGVFAPDVVSAPTEQFALAPFFDFDAPARPIRISMPVDTSLAGLRKFPKNVSFLMSDKLRQQIEAISDAKKALQGDISLGGGFDLGEICSFSIPIITICAMLVLMIFIILLNIVFWWLPLLRICLPLKLKAKG